MNLLASSVIFLGGCICVSSVVIAIAIKRASEDLKIRWDSATVYWKVDSRGDAK